MDRGEEVFADKAFVQHDSILIVVALPRHVSDLDVTTESEFTGLGRVPFGKDITSLDTLALEADRTKVDRGALVRLTELRQAVGRDRIFEAYEELVIRAVVADLDRGSVDEDYFTSALCYDLRTRVTYQLSLDTRTDDRSFGTEERYSLTHHVRSHERTVSIVVLQEGNERSSDRGDLRRRNVHQLNFSGRHDREVSLLTCLNSVAEEVTFVIQRSIPLSYDEVFFFLSGIVLQSLIREVNLPILDATVRRRDEAEVIDLRIDTERRDQTDVWPFRRLNRTETAVVGIVYVTDLEAGTLTRETARTESRETALVRDFGQRVRLVHELRQRVRTEE